MRSAWLLTSIAPGDVKVRFSVILSESNQVTRREKSTFMSHIIPYGRLRVASLDPYLIT